MIRNPGRLAAILLAGAMLLSSAPRRQKRRPQAAAGSFTYYLLSLSWAPDFCAQPNTPKDPAECGKGRKIGFVVHGLWPQDGSGGGPERCGPASPVSQDIIRVMLNYIPTASLIQHEWATHGTCSGLSTADYFAAVRKARDQVAIPNDLRAPAQQVKLAPPEIESKFAAANPSFPAGAFRTSCTGGDLQETRICFSKEVAPMACPASERECPAGSIVILPVQ